MPRIPRRRKATWEEPPAAEQTDAAAQPQADASQQPTTQLSSGDPLAGADAPAATAAGDGTVQTDPVAAASADGEQPTIVSASGAADSGVSDAPTDQPTQALPAVPALPTEGAGAVSAGAEAGGTNAQPGDAESTAAAPASPTPDTATLVAGVEGAHGTAAAGDVAPPAAGSAPTPEAELEAQAAEQAPEDARPGFRDRTRMRRRLRYLKRLRELAFRDLGGLVFDLHRFGRVRNDLVDGKLQALAGIDHELRTLESALRQRTDFTDVREAGIAACPRCGTLHDTDANFCPGCGTSLRSAIVRDASPVTVIPADEATTSGEVATTPGATPTSATPGASGTSDTPAP